MSSPASDYSLQKSQRLCHLGLKSLAHLAKKQLHFNSKSKHNIQRRRGQEKQRS